MSTLAIRPRRLAALVYKEGLQVVRDPSAILIAFVLPVMLLFLFAYAVSLDVRHVRIGLVLESDGDAAHSLAAAFAGSEDSTTAPAPLAGVPNIWTTNVVSLPW